MIAHIPSHGFTKALAILVGFFGITVYLMVRDGLPGLGWWERLHRAGAMETEATVPAASGFASAQLPIRIVSLAATSDAQRDDPVQVDRVISHYGVQARRGWRRRIKKVHVTAPVAPAVSLVSAAVAAPGTSSQPSRWGVAKW